MPKMCPTHLLNIVFAYQSYLGKDFERVILFLRSAIIVFFVIICVYSRLNVFLNKSREPIAVRLKLLFFYFM